MKDNNTEEQVETNEDGSIKQTHKEPLLGDTEKARDSCKDVESKEESEKIKIEFSDKEKREQNYWLLFSDGIKGSAIRFKEFFKNPKRSIKWLFKQKNFVVLLISIISGIVGAGAAWLFGNFISLIRIFFYGVIYNNIPVYWQFALILIIPTFAAAITAPIVHKWSPESKGHGIPEVMESIIYKDGYIKTSTPYIKMLSAGICIGGGLSLGSEGPIAQTGAGLSSFLGRKLGLSGRSIKTVVVCGLVAGISATFNAPIGGVLFGIEVLIVSLNADQLIPVIISSLIATTIGRLVLEKGSRPIFTIPEELKHMGFQDYLPYLHWFILLGIATGFAAVLYIKSVGSVESFVHKLNIHPIIPPIAGAFLTGMIGIISPKSGPQNLEFAPIGLDNPLFGIEDVENIPSIFGNGYETITQLFANSPNLENWSFLGSGVVIVLLLLISLKLLATAFSVGSGNSGGVFAPALFVGAATGYCYATILNSAVKTISFTSQDYALFTLVGLAAVFAGSSRAILTMIFMASELTSSYYAFIPLMITCSISYFISRLTLQDSIYTLKLRQKGLKVSMAGPTDLLETMKVKDIMTTDVICVPENMTMKEFYPLAQTLEYFGYPIINFQGKYQGIVTVVHLRQAQLDGQIDKTVLELGEKDPYVLYPDETVEQAMSLLYRSQIGRIAVLDSPETNNLVGIVSHTDIIKCLELQKVKDHEDRKRADLNMIKHELRVLEETIGEHPQLKEKVKVIRRKPKEALWERNLLEYLRECSEKVPLEPLKEEKHEKSTKPSKKKKSSTAKTTTKSIRTKKPPKTKVEDKKPNENE